MPHAPSLTRLLRSPLRGGTRRPAGTALVAMGCAAGLLAASGSPSASAAPSVASAWSAPARPAAAAPAARADDGPRAVAAQDDARAVLRETTPLTREDALVATDTVLDPDGTSHVRLARSHDGLEVVAGDVVVHQDGDGRSVSVSGDVPAIDVPGTPGVTAPEAAMTAADEVGLPGATVRPELVVLARPGGARLSWQVDVTGRHADGTPSGDRVFVDATSGDVLEQWPTVLPETGSGNGVYSGSVTLDTRLEDDGRYSLVDTDRGATRTLDNTGAGSATLFLDADNSWGNGRRSGRQSAGVDVHWGTARTWDYYLDQHGRSGIGGDGVGARGIVHDGPYVNAYWDDACFCMRYGDGAPRQGFGPVVSLDVVGHEMTHGVTSRTAGLVYRGESGGLNEATSDIMGASVEFHAENATDRGDYVIGEEIFLDRNPARNFIRRMDRPSADGGSQDCRNRRTSRIDVHYSSGPANHFFYLLSEGSGRKRVDGVRYNSPTCDGSTVRGIGREKAEQIWFRALTVYMVPRTDYADARRATVRAATDLYGTGSVEVSRVRGAWSAVRVR